MAHRVGVDAEVPSTAGQLPGAERDDRGLAGVHVTGHPVAGWTTTMFVITVGFAGLFAVLTIAVKYLSLLLELTFKQQKYLVESIEKLQK